MIKGDCNVPFLFEKNTIKELYITEGQRQASKSLTFKKAFFFSLHKDHEGNGATTHPMPSFFKDIQFHFAIITNGEIEDTSETSPLLKDEVLKMLFHIFRG